MAAKKIKLTKGVFATVDEKNFECLSQHKWQYHDQGYATRKKQKNGVRKTIYMHREIMKCPKGVCIDHMDRDRLNNTEANLRRCSRSQNQINRSSSGQSSEYKGVDFKKRAKKWRARISVNWETLHIGHFNTEIEAAKAYDEKAFKTFEEFAVLNFPDEHPLQDHMIPF